MLVKLQSDAFDRSPHSVSAPVTDPHLIVMYIKGALSSLNDRDQTHLGQLRGPRRYEG